MKTRARRENGTTAPASNKASALFHTALGPSALAWTTEGISDLELPSATASVVLERLMLRAGGASPAAPPPWVAQAIARFVGHLAGTLDDLRDVPLDFGATPPFHRKVYDAARMIAPGSTCSYGELAARAGSPLAARAVGQALANNPLPLVVPCHRILAAKGKPGGFSAVGGLVTKAAMLRIEGVS